MRTKPLIVVVTVFALVLGLATIARAVEPSLVRQPEGLGSSISVVSGSAPDSLDPQVTTSAQAAEADWLVYTPLLTYQHQSGAAGSVLIPGLATSLPTVSADGKTYELTLRKGLLYSNGQSVKASDFAYTIERAIRENWGEKSFLTSNIVGAASFDAGEAHSIAGIVTNDSTGKITIKLNQPFGAFANVLAFPGTGLVPSGTPMTDLGANPPPGVGSYKISHVAADGGYTLTRNPFFPFFRIPGIPIGHVETIKVSIVPDNTVEAEQVLNNKADVFDGGDEIPPALLPQIEANAATRFSTQPSASTFFFFLNTTKPPFNSLKARQAVNTALDRQLLARLSSNFIQPSCFFLPEGIVGHPTGPCPYGETPDIAKARQLVEESGMAGTPVTVWGQERSPRREYADYFTEMLNQIGFDASEKIVTDGEYFTAIGDSANDPQVGFADWFQDFPNPSDFYFVMDGRTIQPTDNFNFSKVNDPFVQERLIPLDEVPSTQLSTVAGRWQELDEYVANQAYVAAFGEQVVPKFYSKRIDFNQAVFHVLFGNDFSTLQLK
jgi:peptide/nickel transport system substrate-binding protein